MSIYAMPGSKRQMCVYNCSCCGCTESTTIHQDKVINISLDICNKCGFIYRKHWLDKSSFFEYFREFHKSMPSIHYYMKDWERWGFLSLLHKKTLDESKNHLDIGTYMGHAAQRWGADVSIEMSKGHYRYGRHGLNIDVRNTLEIGEGSFDLITMFGIFTHIPNIGQYLNYLRNKITKGGKFIFTVPFIDRPYTQFVSNRMAPEYVSFFTKRSLENLLDSSGFKIVDSDYSLRDAVIVCEPCEQKIYTECIDESKLKMAQFIEITDLFLKGNHSECLKINKNFYDCETSLAQKNVKDLEFMRAFADRMLSEHKSNYMVKGQMASVFYNHRRYDKAIPMLEDVKTKYCAYDIYWHLGLCYYDMGEYKKAHENYEWVWKINPLFGTNVQIDDKQDMFKIKAANLSKIEG